MNSVMRRAAVSFVAVLVATGMAGPSLAQDYSGPEFDAAVRSYIESNPQVILDSINSHIATQQQVEQDAKDASFLAMTEEFVGGPELPVVGNPEGSVTMVYVLDAACTYCRRMTPVISELVEANPDLKIVQRWVPFLTPASEYAARVVDVVKQRYPASYEEFYHALMMQTSALTNETIDRLIAQILGEDVLALIRQDNVGTEGSRLDAVVASNLDITKRAGIDGTPFFYVDGLGAEGIFRGAVPANLLQDAIDKAGASN